MNSQVNLSSMFSRPLLIYDDTCLSCGKFAEIVNLISRGWIRIAGHHYSKEASEAKQVIFPKGYDATKMFWLINSKGAYGARAGLMPMVKEVLIGLLVHNESLRLNTGAVKYSCDVQSSSCMSTQGLISRIMNMAKTSVVFPFDQSHRI
jgi:hypothetical protein